MAALVVLTGASACTTLTPPPARGTPSPYVVEAPDSLSISILPEPTLELTAVVRPDGKISIPLIGETQAGGLTIPQIAADIETRMAKFKRGSQVTVALTAAVHTDITILGEVNGPTSFPLIKDTRIVEALGQVGGTTDFAWDSRIRVIRTSGGETTIHRVNLTKIRRGDLSTNLLLEPGDIVYVPATIMARIGYAVQSVLFPLQPLLGLAQSAGGNVLVP
jgi:polysaccharide export outer membrane protein